MKLMYANGNGYINQMTQGVGRVNLTDVDVKANLYFRHPSQVPLSPETHAGEDVLVYATGPWSHLFTGVYEQNALPIMVAHAACLNGSCKDLLQPV